MGRAIAALSAALLLWSGFAGAPALASGTSPYLPLNLSPGIERKVERVMILAGMPVMTRPIPIARVLQALPKACRRDATLCAQVRHYLNRYFKTSDLSYANVEVAAANRSKMTLPNERGERADSPFDASAQVYVRPWDHLLISAGGLGYGGTEGRFDPDSTMVSTGDEYLQLDVGYRDHWFSPLTDSSMLLSTEAPSIPGVTISSQRPLGPLGFSYEIFFARLPYTNEIAWHNGLTAGYPRLTGFHFAIEPVDNWSLAGNAVYQYGGGARPGSLKTLLDGLTSPTVFCSDANVSPTDCRRANREISLTSAYTVTGPTPFETYVEYAGRDTFHGEVYRFHETGLSAGVHFPELWKKFDLTLEASEWQNAWFNDYVWLEGMTVNGYVDGQWGADWRQFSGDVGARSAMAQLGWSFDSGDSLNLRYRTLQNANYTAQSPSYPYYDYHRAHMATLEYAQPRNGYTRGLTLDAGRDVYGSGFARLAAFVRFDGGRAQDADSNEDSDESETEAEAEDQPASPYQRFIDLGVSGGRSALDLLGFTDAQEHAAPETRTVTSPHFGIGVRRRVSTWGDLGVRAEVDNFDGLMLGLRALDYRYRLGRHLAAGGFFGFARYSAPTPAQGYYYGAGLQWRDLMPHWDLSLDWRRYDKLQRDKVLPTDPQNGDPAEAYTLNVATLYLSWRF